MEKGVYSDLTSRSRKSGRVFGRNIIAAAVTERSGLGQCLNLPVTLVDFNVKVVFSLNRQAASVCFTLPSVKQIF